MDREADQAQREALLRDKDLLMEEVHHRVRNSLFLVQGLLRQQIRAARLPEVRDELEQAIRRVSSIAAVHRQLYSGGSLGRIVAVEYLGSLLRDMAASSPERAIRLDAPADLAWSADRATTCGLVVTELVINALKYGRGAVTVRVEPGADEADSIAVEDEGRDRRRASTRPVHRPRDAHPAGAAAGRPLGVRPLGRARALRRPPSRQPAAAGRASGAPMRSAAEA